MDTDAPLAVRASSRRRPESDPGKQEDRDASQSRISDHIEITRNNNSNSNANNKGEQDCDNSEDEINSNNKSKRQSDATATRIRRNANRRYSQGPGLKWHKQYADLDVKAGRVLMIDYARSDKSRSHIRQVVAQEIFNIHELHRFYKSTTTEPAMRVIHVQNAEWAVPFLLQKFNIVPRSPHDVDNVGADFGRYMKYKKPEIRGGKPFLVGKTWKVQYDPFRGVNKTSFGLDYMKGFPARRGVARTDGDRNNGSGMDRMMQLNDFDDNDEPIYSHDVYAQRLSCYIQHKQAPSENRLSRDGLSPRRKSFYPPDMYGDSDADNKEGSTHKAFQEKQQRRVRHLDNGNVIIIFDNSSSGCIDDTLIPARRDLECRWRRLPFLLAFESRDPIEEDGEQGDTRLAVNCSKSILSDIFKALVMTWAGFLDHAVTHMNILEDRIYDRPDDESRAPELWANSSAWLKVEKLVNVHISVMHEMKARLHELTDDVDNEDNWLEDSPGDFDRLTNMVTEDLTKPTESLISLLYQSVSIRDSRHSLELGVSMWRLSWITFIFLPLTFIVGFFGMNVDTFQNDPSIKWYFIAAIPFMLGVVAFYFFMKRSSSGSRPTPHERAVYESFFQEMADRNPTLWSRNGPRDYINVDGRIARMKWSLIKHWLRRTNLNINGSGKNNIGSSMNTATTSSMTPAAAIISDAEDTISGRALLQSDGLSTLSRMQRYLSRRWTAQIAGRATTMEPADTELGLMNLNSDFEDLTSVSGSERFSSDHTHITHTLDYTNRHSIGEGLTEIAEILAAPAVPRSGHPGPFPSSVDHDHDHHEDQGHINIRTHLTVPGGTLAEPQYDDDNNNEDDTNSINNGNIQNPIIAAAISREQRRRLRSNSSPSPSSSSARGRGRRPRSSGGGGSSAGRNSRNSDRGGVLVEEEDTEWLNERGRKGKDWFWRRSASSRGSSGGRD